MVSRKESLIRAVLRKAREVKDPLTELVPAVRQCNANGQLVQVRSYHARDMPKDLHAWCLDVCRENMAAMYNRVWTWSDAKKRKQLTSAASRFLVAHEASTSRTPLGYVNYRFEQDEGEAVLYCYELQVALAAQGRGLGHTLMELTEQIAWGAGMSKVLLTVFRENAAALGFYVKRGYRLDETSPDYSQEHPLASGGSHGRAPGSASIGDASAGGSSVGVSSAGGSSGCGSGSQESDAGEATGYHIMSKRAPAQPLPQLQAPLQLHSQAPPPPQAQAQAQIHEQASAEEQGKARMACQGQPDARAGLQVQAQAPLRGQQQQQEEEAGTRPSAQPQAQTQLPLQLQRQPLSQSLPRQEEPLPQRLDPPTQATPQPELHAQAPFEAALHPQSHSDATWLHADTQRLQAPPQPQSQPQMQTRMALQLGPSTHLHAEAQAEAEVRLRAHAEAHLEREAPRSGEAEARPRAFALMQPGVEALPHGGAPLGHLRQEEWEQPWACTGSLHRLQGHARPRDLEEQEEEWGCKRFRPSPESDRDPTQETEQEAEDG